VNKDGDQLVKEAREARRKAYHQRQDARLEAPTPERLAKAGQSVEVAVMDDIDGDGVVTQSYRIYRMTDVSPLENLASRDRKKPGCGITGEQYGAGNRYFESAFLAGVLASGVPDLLQERVDGGQHKGIADKKLEAAQRYAMALKALDQLSVHVLNHVVILEKPLVSYVVPGFKEDRERRAVALDRLRRALDSLIKHYEQVDGVRPRRHRLEVMRELPTQDDTNVA
jgi:hypothetical protein